VCENNVKLVELIHTIIIIVHSVVSRTKVRKVHNVLKIVLLQFVILPLPGVLLNVFICLTFRSIIIIMIIIHILHPFTMLT